MSAPFQFETFCESPPENDLPPLDRANPSPDLTLNGEQAFWRENGYLVLPRFLPDSIIDPYVDYCTSNGLAPRCWPEPCPFTHQPLMRDITCHRPLVDKIEMLIGTPMVLNLALTPWKSTTRTWHQDDYLNQPYINCWYAAVWIALADLDPGCGLFEYVPKSHKWPLMRGHKIRESLPAEIRERPDWPRTAEELVTPLFEKKIEETGSSINRFHAKKGDVLIWHARLAHRGSLPNDPNLNRPSIIAHYSALAKRHFEYPRIKRHKDQGWYFLLENSVSA